MSTRIRYERVSGGEGSTGVYKSVRTFAGYAGRVLSARFTEFPLVWTIEDHVTGEVITQGSGRSVAVLKTKLKRALADLGVTFSEESRQRKTREEELAAS